jgi:hypothetical protein
LPGGTSHRRGVYIWQGGDIRDYSGIGYSAPGELLLNLGYLKARSFLALIDVHYLSTPMKRWLIISSIMFIAGIVIYANLPPSKPLDKSVSIDKLVVIKSERKLYAYSQGALIKSYHISLGRRPEGKKHFKGDYRTPEGIYTIDSKNSHSSCYMNLGISYPNQTDMDYAKANSHSPGGSVKIHGLQNGLGIIGRLHRLMDWTAGCIALTNDEMDELYRAVKIGSPIEIKP